MIEVFKKTKASKLCFSMVVVFVVLLNVSYGAPSLKKGEEFKEKDNGNVTTPINLSTGSIPATASKNYYPLKVGNKLTYQWTTPGGTSTTTTEVTQYDGSSYSAKSTASYSSGDTVYHFVLQNNSWVELRSGRLVFPSKIDIGTHEGDITIDALESVTVPAGTFNNALKCTISTQTATQTVWFADGVGMVKITGASYSAELTNYIVK